MQTTSETDSVALSLGGSVYDPADPVGRLLFNVLGMVAEFEADLIRMRTREGMAIAKAKGKLRGKQPKLTAAKRRHLLAVHTAGTHTQTELAELFDVSRATIYRELQRAQAVSALFAKLVVSHSLISEEGLGYGCDAGVYAGADP